MAETSVERYVHFSMKMLCTISCTVVEPETLVKYL
jgi:hypothetical protein